MKTKGKLIAINSTERGTSINGKEWQKRTFIVDIGEKYNNLICFSLFGDKTDIIDDYTIGQDIEVEANVSSKEFNGKWYHNIDAWKISKSTNNF